MLSYRLFIWSPLSGLSEREIECAAAGHSDLLDLFHQAGCDAILHSHGRLSRARSPARNDGARRDRLVVAQSHDLTGETFATPQVKNRISADQ